MKKTKETLAKQLNGREYGDEISDAECQDASESGLVVVFGYSDDNIEFRGAIREEIGCYDEKTVLLNKGGVVAVPDDDEREVLEKFGALKAATQKGAELIARFGGDPAWTFETEIPHATFDIMEDGECFCRGVVFELKSLP